MGSRREIGGYLELERFAGRPYHEGAIALNSGRACLEYLIELRCIEVIWLPDWLCSSVPDACRRRGIVVKTYRVGPDMRPAYDFSVGECEWLYLVDYYGQLVQADVETALGRCSGRLILDEAQGFFRKPWPGADTLYTCRKFFGVADGAYLYTKDGARLDREFPRDESHRRMGFVLGRFERPAGEFFAESKENNAHFAAEPVKAMSPITENILRAVDYEGVKQRREENWAYLHGRLGESNLLGLRVPEGPFMYPYLVDEANRVRQRLAQADVFVPTLWPNMLGEMSIGNMAGLYSANILPLPVDQRYGVEEMSRVIEVLHTIRGLE